MAKYDLSIIIPARNEMFLKQTVDNILENIEGNTEIIVILDGAWANPPLQNHPRLTVIYHGESMGQRASVNEGVKMSQSKFVMKVDAHCAFDKGFDVKLMQDCEPNWVVIPRMYNLHAFNWKCKKCGHEVYQGRTPNHCEKCENTTEFERAMVWKPRLNKKTDFARFDKDLHFRYWGAYGERPEAQDDIADVMCFVGACRFMHREFYWYLEGCDEKHGSWGQEGVEWSCKTWLSGGRLVVNKKTWFSHMFRTQGGDFGFPYPQSENKIEGARLYSRDLWQNNKWPKQVHPFSWLIEKFAPIPSWHDTKDSDTVIKEVKQKVKKPTKGVVYYSHNVTDSEVFKAVQRQILKGIKEKHIVSVTNIPTNFGKNIVFPRIPEAGFLDLFERVLLGLRNSTADIIFLAEHDVLYHPSHYDFIPPKKDVYYYNENVWHLRAEDGFALYHENKLLSQMCAYREFLIKHYEARIAKILKSGFSRKMGFEPGTHNRPERVDDFKAEAWRSKLPCIDIRTGTNSTESKWTKEEFRNQKFTKGWTEAWEIPGWGKTKDRVTELLNSL